MIFHYRLKPAFCWLALFLALPLLKACSATATPTAFIPPRTIPSTQPAPPGEKPGTPTLTPQPDPIASPTATLPCSNDLSYVDDLTIPDGTRVLPGSTIEKDWLVQNSGTCNWDDRYRLIFTGGVAMSAPTEQALFPARAGSQATISITFTAPTDPGTYASAWQALAPDGSPFGDAIFMEIIVQ